MKISIIGAAGNIGSAITMGLIQQKMANTVAMVDLESNLFEQQFSDMHTASYLRGVNVIRGNYETMLDSNLVIIAAARQLPKEKAAIRADMLKANIGLFNTIAEAIKSYCPLATIIHVSNPVEPLAHFLHKAAGLRPGQLLGYTLNDTIRFKIMLRNHLGLTAKDKLNAIVMGEHGSTNVLVFDYIYVNGKRVSINTEIQNQIRDEDRAVFPQLEYLQQATGRTSAWTTAMGVSDMVAALNAPRPTPFVCSTYLTGEYGHRDVYCSVPVKLGLGLLQEVKILELSGETKAALDYSVATIEQACATALEESHGD